MKQKIYFLLRAKITTNLLAKKVLDVVYLH